MISSEITSPATAPTTAPTTSPTTAPVTASIALPSASPAIPPALAITTAAAQPAKIFSQTVTGDDLSKMSDEALFQLCRKFGTNAVVWRRKFIGLLPEANRRHLYQKKRFRTIFDFAFMMGGVSSPQVTLAVYLDRIFEDKPTLRKLLIQGQVSINKLSRIASVATKENEEFWAKQVTLLSYRAIETLVRDHRLTNKEEENSKLGPLFEKRIFENNAGTSNIANYENSLRNNLGPSKFTVENGYQKPQNDHQFLRAQNGTPDPTIKQQSTIQSTTQFQLHPNILKLQLSPLAISKLLELQNKGIDINKIILEITSEREEKITQTKENLSANLQPAKSRYIPAQVKKVIAEEHGQKCSIKTCSKPAAVVHHTQRYALARAHDPNFMAPLCKEHHLIAHSIDVKYQQTRAGAIGPGS